MNNSVSTRLKFSFPAFVWLKPLYILFKKYLSPSDQIYSHYISNFEYKSCHMNYIGMNFIFLLINSVAILHPQGLSLFWVRTVWFHIWYHTVGPKTGLAPSTALVFFFWHLSKNSPLARNCKSYITTQVLITKQTICRVTCIWLLNICI